MAFGGKTLTVYLAADISKLKKGLNDADDGFKIFGHSLNNLVGPALIGAAAAAGAFAVKLGVDAAQAAMQEEAELTKLGTTLDNLGFGSQSEKVNKFIDDLQYSAAVTDSELRPAFDRLVRSTGSVTEAQDALKLALDVSAGTGKSLETVANALGRAYDGNTGALGKLGAGIDAATLKSGDMAAINEKLTTTFHGQSEAAANTAQGGMKKLQIATDELIEAFGTGLIGAAEDSSTAINDSVQRMRDAQPAAERLGTEVNKTAIAWSKFAEDALLAGDAISAGDWGLATKLIFGSGDALVYAEKQARGLGDQFQYVQYEAYKAGAAMAAAFAFGGAETGGTPTTAYNGINAMGNLSARFKALAKDIAGGDGGGGGGGGLSGAVDKVNPKLQKQIDLVKSLTTQLQDAAKKVEAARKEMNDWQESMAASITSGIDLGAAFEQQFAVDDAGKKIGVGLLEGFQKQIDQAGIFGGYLQQLNSEGGPELRDAVAALGPEAGNKLAKQMIDEGLVKTFQEKLVTVKSTARTAADAMTPEFLIAGVNSAVNFLIGTQNTLAAATNDLEAMGAAMGKTIGDAAAAAILEAVNKARETLGQGQATLAGTSTPSTLANGLPSAYAGQNFSGGMGFIGPDAVAQAIARAIANSNSRLGAAPQNVLQ